MWTCHEVYWLKVLVYAEYAGHAREIVRTMRLDEWNGIVIVSGDGLIFEVCEISATFSFRVRMILVFGYWALCNICRYWTVLLICYWATFFWLWHPIWYWIQQQSAPPHDNHLDICGVAVVSRRRHGEWGGVKCKLYVHHHHHTV